MLEILDVGHGNSAVIEYANIVVVIDAGPGNKLLEYLMHKGIGRVDYLLISHADQDHIAGTLAVVNNLELGEVFLNSDALKGTDIWEDLTILLDKEDRSGTINLEPSLFETESFLSLENLKIDILAPSKHMVLKGVGSTNRFGSVITHNSISAVIKVSLDDAPAVLFTGDIDSAGLEEITYLKKDLAAEVLVYPHHGGISSNQDQGRFIETLQSLVNYKEVIFSNGRGRYDNPKEEVVNKILELNERAYVACTQLSKRCSSLTPDTVEMPHLEPSFSAGEVLNNCCAGTIRIDLKNKCLDNEHKSGHSKFIDLAVESPLCRIDKN